MINDVIHPLLVKNREEHVTQARMTHDAIFSRDVIFQNIITIWEDRIFVPCMKMKV
ncbi:MAG: hypothetical protein P9L92_12035 [Candidatus Electryonea clarkiae]|nr:hypothetical protein [Candidatus Electryonea clarkiae]MDP8285976.1 hypothetical protein [Candidatus Electryonea clarkiae]